MFHADAALSAGASLPLSAEHEERAVYVLAGDIDIAGDRFDSVPGANEFIPLPED